MSRAFGTYLMADSLRDCGKTRKPIVLEMEDRLNQMFLISILFFNILPIDVSTLQTFEEEIG